MPGADPARDLRAAVFARRPQAEAVLLPVAKLGVEPRACRGGGVASLAGTERPPNVRVGPDRDEGLAVPLAPAPQLEPGGPDGLGVGGGYVRRSAVSPPCTKVSAWSIIASASSRVGGESRSVIPGRSSELRAATAAEAIIGGRRSPG